MLLVIDIGNTNIVLGVFKDKELIKSWRISTNREKTADEYGIQIRILFHYAQINPQWVSAIIIASVVPPLTRALEEMSQRYFGVKPLIVGPGIKTQMPIKYENPREVGADRIVNAVAAYELYGGPVIVVDFGTATTFDAISERGEYLGGAIAPGIGISTEALFARAAKLTRVELAVPPSVIGRNTVQSLQAGIVYGFAGQVDFLVQRMKKEMGGNPRVVATGGLAQLIKPVTSTLDLVDQDLTLKGLRIIYERNI